MSSKFPIGVATIYKPGFILTLFILFIFLNSCAPVNYITINNDKEINKNNLETSEEVKKSNNDVVVNTDIGEKKEKIKKPNPYKKIEIKKNVSIILPNTKKTNITEQFINVIELATYKKSLKNISFDINLYNDSENLIDIIEKEIKPGKIFIGPLDTKDTKFLEKYCKKGVIFFSFSSQKNLAKDCVFLINFFPKNEIVTLFDYFSPGSKVALLFPENSYGYNINKIVDEVADQSDSIIINRASYKEDLTNVRDAIKELGKYELRKYELNRQKQILLSKNDENSKKRLKKLEKFQTTKDLDFTHILIPDYGIRLLQVAPLLPYYDVDPNLIQFVGTGVWDDPVFFNEPSLNNAIFPGVDIVKREGLIKEYSNIYHSNLMRISTLPYDLIGLLSYIYQNEMSLFQVYEMLNDDNIKFDGVDGGFYFRNNIIERDLKILQIFKGKAKKIN